MKKKFRQDKLHLRMSEYYKFSVNAVKMRAFKDNSGIVLFTTIVQPT